MDYAGLPPHRWDEANAAAAAAASEEKIHFI
jgi:hypothetical protein